MDARMQRLLDAARQARGLRADAGATTLGSITLLPHQSAAVRWLRPRLARYGGALLADPPGLGKTYVALALAAERGWVPLVIAPASLRRRWQDAAAETGVAIVFVSTERLSAPAAISTAPAPFVIIDEAHHLRTCSTRRHHRTTALCADATVLMLSATPIQNRAEDLEHLTRLFHLPPTQASLRQLRRRLTLRRSLAAIQATWPTLAHRGIPPVTIRNVRCDVADRCALLEQLHAVPALAGDDAEGHALLRIGVLHALRSSDAAARLRIHRRIAATIAIEQAASHGMQHSATLRRAWQASDGAIQLALTPVLGGAPVVKDPSRVHAARQQRVALEALLPLLTGDGDAQRSSWLRRLARWASSPVVAFTQFAATGADQFRRLRDQPGVALLTGTGARIASGSVSRDEVLERLLHPKYGARRDAVRLLIATDVLSEGLSLAGVGTVVHLDLPWTPARLDQRVGRAARIGAPVSRVRVLSLPAPLPEQATSALLQLLARKRRQMGHFEHRADDVVALLRTRPDHGTPAARGWAVIRARDATTLQAVAIVRVARDRLLVALDSTGLRGPTAQDWRVLAHGEAAALHRGIVRRTHRAMTAALWAWHADRELTTVVRDRRGTWMQERRAGDEAVLAARAGHRLIHAAAASEWRRRHAKEAARPQRPAPGRDAEVRTHSVAGARVRILAGICVVPHEA